MYGAEMVVIVSYVSAYLQFVFDSKTTKPSALRHTPNILSQRHKDAHKGYPKLSAYERNKTKCVILNRSSINVDLITPFLLLQRLRQHQLPHPVNPRIPRLDREMMRLPFLHQHLPLPLVPFPQLRHKLELKRRVLALILLLAVANAQRLQLGRQLLGRQRAACDRVVVHVDGGECLRGWHRVVVG